MSGSINEAEGLRPQRDPSAFSIWVGPLLVALVALGGILLTLDGVGETAAHFDSPGLTLDEVFNIQTGVYLTRALVLEGPLIFTPDGAERVFDNPLANPDHPPLGRLAIGISHELIHPWIDPGEPDRPYSVMAARCASALLFALTVLLVGWCAGRWYGAVAGTTAALAFLLMPRAFGHAHLAALETGIGLTFTATVLFVAGYWGAGCADVARTPRWRVVFAAGLLFGLALLTKIQAVLLPVPIGLWCLWKWRLRAVLPLLLFGVVASAVFFVGWPWLWLDPLGNLQDYFASKAKRPTLYCYYLGHRYADVDVPWHYPIVLFLTTVPVGLHLLGLWGCVARRPALIRDDRCMLLAGVTLFVLAFFALPGLTVYDGTRLFLVVFPLWAVLIGRAVAVLTRKTEQSSLQRWLAIGLLAGGATEGVAGLVRLQPCQLSFYNLAVGGLDGADRLGFEPTYWRDSFTREFLEQVADNVPAGATLYVAPVLHPANRIDLELLSPILQQHRLHFDAYDDQDPAKTGMRYVLVFRRHADPWDSLEPEPSGGKLLCEVRRSDVQLAALYDLAGP